MNFAEKSEIIGFSAVQSGNFQQKDQMNSSLICRNLSAADTTGEKEY